MAVSTVVEDFGAWARFADVCPVLRRSITKPQQQMKASKHA